MPISNEVITASYEAPFSFTYSSRRIDSRHRWLNWISIRHDKKSTSSLYHRTTRCRKRTTNLTALAPCGSRLECTMESKPDKTSEINSKQVIEPINCPMRTLKSWIRQHFIQKAQEPPQITKQSTKPMKNVFKSPHSRRIRIEHEKKEIHTQDGKTLKRHRIRNKIPQHTSWTR